MDDADDAEESPSDSDSSGYDTSEISIQEEEEVSAIV
ncbi:hypothetical protein PC116_g10283 [Phytophthora cactorum]|nr:hypothetical protein PC116_g10283 [Phytophthora cactorum]